MIPLPKTQNRRKLPKTKSGCRRCKKRRIKCDEGQPSCRNCVRHGVHCDFLPPVGFSMRSSVGSSIPSEYTISDLELLHHFTTSVCVTLSAEPLARNFWKLNIPQIGFEANYLLRGILALSALHLARFRVGRKEFYMTQAMVHHNAALAMVLPLVMNINDNNCVPLFLFGTVTLYFALAKPKDPADFLLASGHSIPEWFYLFKGIRAVMDAKRDTIETSAISGMFEAGIQSHRIWFTHTFNHEAFKELEVNIREAVPDHQSRLSILLEALLALKRSFYLVYEHSQADESRSRAVFICLYIIKDEYVSLVKDGDSEAFCILAFFCVLLKRMDCQWWTEGWSTHLMERIYTFLNPVYRLWLRWPMEEIGWTPGS